MMPATAIRMTVVPRSGCLMTSAAGIRSSSRGEHQRPDPAHLLEADGVEIPGEHEDQGDLHDLRWLEPDRAELDPPLSAAARDPAELGSQQQQDRQAPHPVGQVIPDSRDEIVAVTIMTSNATPKRPIWAAAQGKNSRRRPPNTAGQSRHTAAKADRKGKPPVDQAEPAEDRGPFLRKVHRPHRGTCIIGSGAPGGRPGRAAGGRGPARPVRRCRCSVSGS